MASYKGLAAPLNAKGVFEAGLTIAKSKYIRFSTPLTTTVPTTGSSQGDLFLVIKSSTPQLAVCTDGSNSLMYFTANTSTYGRSSTT
jgi:hypothetical protein